jgi:cardiolipin synthase A/B
MDRVVAFFAELGYYVAGALTLLLAIAASGHAILWKRDTRAAVAWVGVIWLVPVVGVVLYTLLGVNRIRRRGSTIRADAPRLTGSYAVLGGAETVLADVLADGQAHLGTLACLVDRVSRRPLTAGNGITPLVNGDAAYPAMLAAIEGARRSIALSTFIFDSDVTGRMFAKALARAVHRGVETRVLIDGVGARFSWPPIVRLLRRSGIPVARFMPTIAPWRAPFWNLRNHRKILVVDGTTGFTGGMNVRQEHLVAAAPRVPVQDLHFQLQGPVVEHLMEVFAEDWLFTTRELLSGPQWFPELAPAGRVAARGISDGPDEDFERLRWVIQGALGLATESIRVMTPYFLPDATLTAMLNVAALRGVRVEILLPAKNNHPLADWASQALLWQFVKLGCTVCYTPPPFDHTKLMVVDGAWVLLGSSNWDPRSLRLNFEFNVECYDAALGEEMGRFMDAKLRGARVVTAAELDGMSLLRRLRNGIARLASPYL